MALMMYTMGMVSSVVTFSCSKFRSILLLNQGCCVKCTKHLVLAQMTASQFRVPFRASRECIRNESNTGQKTLEHKTKYYPVRIKESYVHIQSGCGIEGYIWIHIHALNIPLTNQHLYMLIYFLYLSSKIEGKPNSDFSCPIRP